FSEPINLNAFTPAQVTVTGPQTPVVSTITLVGGSTYLITFATPLATAGNYQVTIAQSVAGINGFQMDQNGNGIAGETGDVFSANVTIDTTGPHVVSASPTGTLSSGQSFVNVTFSEPILASSFTTSQVSISGPNGVIHPLSVTPLSTTQFQIGFAFQTA